MPRRVHSQQVVIGRGPWLDDAATCLPESLNDGGHGFGALGAFRMTGRGQVIGKPRGGDNSQHLVIL